ncbi:hypothetical protein PRIPAC_84934, partial [Pristionchus pacificus]|uniref:Uncharacterized protein n=1 Tax=Pristionchus pacificus TaxID=54126 RepID=A0A2A6CC98_PRIPA
WLDGKSTRERTLILEKALKGRNEIVREEQKRADQLGEAIVRKMEAEKVDYERKVLRSDVRKSKITQELGALEEDDFRSFYLAHLRAHLDITLSDGKHGSGEVTIHLNGSSGIFTISRSLFEDLINDDAIVPL